MICLQHVSSVHSLLQSPRGQVYRKPRRVSYLASKVLFPTFAAIPLAIEIHEQQDSLAACACMLAKGHSYTNINISNAHML